jgi:formiminotetrahydrofolate cyclodeaminase
MGLKLTIENKWNRFNLNLKKISDKKFGQEIYTSTKNLQVKI